MFALFFALPLLTSGVQLPLDPYASSPSLSHDLPFQQYQRESERGFQNGIWDMSFYIYIFVNILRIVGENLSINCLITSQYSARKCHVACHLK